MTDIKRQGAAKGILFGVIFMILLSGFSAAVNPTKWFDDMRIQDRNARITQMMEQRPDSIDILNIGDSLSESALTPMELWRQKGYTSFNIGADGILMAEAYYAVLTACEDQHPKYLLMEALPLFRLKENQDLQICLSQPLYYRFAFLKYHSLWKTLIEGRGVRIYHKGYLVNRIARRYKPDYDYMNQELKPDDRTKIPDFNRLWFERIRKYCDNRGIRLILYSLPSPVNYNWERVRSVEELAAEDGIEYIDFNSRTEELGIKLEGDFSDKGDHLNLDGAIKVSGFFGDYIAEKGDLTDHRQDGAYSDWNEELTEYDQLVEQMEGKSFYHVQQEQEEKKKEKKE